jgi:hypothetical protein
VHQLSLANLKNWAIGFHEKGAKAWHGRQMINDGMRLNISSLFSHCFSVLWILAKTTCWQHVSHENTHCFHWTNHWIQSMGSEWNLKAWLRRFGCVQSLCNW